MGVRRALEVINNCAPFPIEVKVVKGKNSAKFTLEYPRDSKTLMLLGRLNLTLRRFNLGYINVSAVSSILVYLTSLNSVLNFLWDQYLVPVRDFWVFDVRNYALRYVNPQGLVRKKPIPKSLRDYDEYVKMLRLCEDTIKEVALRRIRVPIHECGTYANGITKNMLRGIKR